MRLGKRLQNLLSDKKGNVLVLAAAAMPLLVGSAGIAIDTIQLSLLKRHLQRAADSGALAGAYAKVQEKDYSAAATRAISLNDAFPLARTPEITEPPQPTQFAGRSVKVKLTATRSLPFWTFFTGSAPVIAAEATAALVYTGRYCMISLDESNGTGITFGGTANINLGCGVISNSSGSEAVRVNGGNNGSVTASPVAAVGYVPANDIYGDDTLLLPYSLKQPDPFKDAPDPAPQNCQPAITDGTGPQGPGCYTGFSVGGAMTLDPGTYYITGNFSVGAQANLTALGVTFVFTNNPANSTPSYPSVSITAGAELHLSAPTSTTEPYPGLLMYYDRRAPLQNQNQGHHINGNADSEIAGALYFPTQNLTVNGTADFTSTCLQLVARTLTFSGGGRINNTTCPENSGAKKFDASWVRLVA